MTTNNAVNTSLSGQTGTGNFVGATSPTLVTPALGTPSSGTLTNCTGLPIAGTTGYGTGVGTALAANVTGSGGIVLATSPTLVTPALGAATATSINFGGSTLANYVSNTSWTPTFTFATPGNISVSYSTQVGNYSRIGSIVHLTFVLVCTPTFTTSSGNANIGGIPFASNSASGNSSVGNMNFTGFTSEPSGCTSNWVEIGTGVSVITLGSNGPSGNTANFVSTNFTSGTQITIIGSITYLV